MTTLMSGFACNADCTEGWIFVAHSVTPTLISCTILQFGQFSASTSLMPFTSGIVGGTSLETISRMLALPSVLAMDQLARIVPTSLKPIVSDEDTSGCCSNDGS